MATVGYGDIVATTRTEMVVAVIMMIIGVSVFAYVAGSASELAFSYSDSIPVRIRKRVRDLKRDLVRRCPRSIRRLSPACPRLFLRLRLRLRLSSFSLSFFVCRFPSILLALFLSVVLSLDYRRQLY
jgi:hypothetical protein